MMLDYQICEYNEKVGKSSTDKIWKSKPLNYDLFNDLINNNREHGLKLIISFLLIFLMNLNNNSF